MVARALAVAALAAGSAAAQEPAGSIRGLVVDSLLARGPLGGATVEVLELGRRTRTDDRGVFRFDSVPGGRYTVFFTHPDLDAIGLQPREATVSLGAGIAVSVTLTTPSEAAIFGALCRGRYEDQTGVLLGRVTDTRDRPIAAAEVRGEWEVAVLEPAGLARRSRVVRGAAEPSGRYQLCGVPTDVPVLLTVRTPGVVGPPLELRMGDRLVAVRHLSLELADSAAPRTARVAGTIRGADGRPVSRALVGLLGLPDATRSDSGGRFALGGLPAGSHTLDVRAIGFERGRANVELRAGSVATADVVMAAAAQQLPEVTVASDAGVEDPTGFDRRMRAGFGRFISRDDIRRRGTIRTEDLFKAVPGMRVEPIGGSAYRILSTRGGTGFSTVCEPAFYIDRIRLPPSQASEFGDNGTDLPVDPLEIHGIEIYQNVADAPLEFRTSSGFGTPTCAIVLIWTRRGGRR